MTSATVLSKQTILLVDDDDGIRCFLADVLACGGFNVLSAADAEHALRLCASYSGEIHLLLSDIQMPGMTGIDLAIRLHRERPGIKIILMSGISVENSSLKYGGEFIRKPFLAGTLEQDIRRLLGQNAPEATIPSSARS